MHNKNLSSKNKKLLIWSIDTEARFKEFSELFYNKYEDSDEDMIDDIQSTNRDPFEEMNKAMQAINRDPLENFRKAMETLNRDPLENFRESMKTLKLDPLKKLKDSIKTMYPPSSIVRFLKSISSEKWPLLYEDYEDLSISDDGTISIGSDSISFAKLEMAIEKVVNNSISKQTNQLDERFDQLHYEVNKLNDPLVKKLIIALIVELLINILIVFLEPRDHSYIEKTKSNIQEKLTLEDSNKIATLREENKYNLNSFRIVKASKLNVRKSASKEADKIGALNKGSLVIVINTKPYWTLVRWQDKDTNTVLQGWVATMHLDDIN